MPVILPEGLETAPLCRALRAEHAAVLTEGQAVSQDIRPARIGILNLMPAGAMDAAELQWLSYISHTPLQVEPVFIKFDNDHRERPGSSRAQKLASYTAFSQIVDKGLDGLIVTGDNLEIKDGQDGHPCLFPFEEVAHREELDGVIDWARVNVFSTIYSCWGGHYALNRLHGLERELTDKKTFGVFDHVVDHRSGFATNMNDIIKAPHSRWGNIPVTQVLGAATLELLAHSDEAGWLLAQDKNKAGGLDMYIQGHPEYRRWDLHREFMRDFGTNPEPPANYYPNNDSKRTPLLTWVDSARTLHANWINSIYRHFSNPQNR